MIAERIASSAAISGKNKEHKSVSTKADLQRAKTDNKSVFKCYTKTSFIL